MRKKIELIMAVCLILTALFAATHRRPGRSQRPGCGGDESDD